MLDDEFKSANPELQALVTIFKKLSIVTYTPKNKDELVSTVRETIRCIESLIGTTNKEDRTEQINTELENRLASIFKINPTHESVKEIEKIQIKSVITHLDQLHSDLISYQKMLDENLSRKDNLPATITALYNALVKAKIKHELLVVNDNSSDGTLLVLRGLKHKVPTLNWVTNNPPNGFGLAVRKGLKTFKGDAVAIVILYCLLHAKRNWCTAEHK